MDNPKKIVWLASYPKSGNTWFRAFLTALINPCESDVDINNLYQTTIASSRQLFDEMVGISSADLTSGEIDRMRPMVYRQNALESKEIIYHKIHDAWTLLPSGEPLFPVDVTKVALYFIRNPLDVAVSFAHHLNTNIDKTIEIMNNPGYSFCQHSDRLHNQLRQKLLTWSGHVESWVDRSSIPLMVMRYEDMKEKTVETFSKSVSFIGLNFSFDEIKVALDLASFSRLKMQEEQKGFTEKSANTGSFFRKGIVGDWKNMLTREQVDRIIEAHSKIMNRFGYLNGAG